MFLGRASFSKDILLQWPSNYDVDMPCVISVETRLRADGSMSIRNEMTQDHSLLPCLPNDLGAMLYAKRSTSSEDNVFFVFWIFFFYKVPSPNMEQTPTALQRWLSFCRMKLSGWSC